MSDSLLISMGNVLSCSGPTQRSRHSQRWVGRSSGYPLNLWRQLLRRSAVPCDPGEYRALNATFFDREAVSSHYVGRLDSHIYTLDIKTILLIDTESCSASIYTV